MKIKGKEYGFKFSYRAIREFMQMTNCSFSDLSDTNKIALFAPEMIFCGVKAGQYFNKAEFDLSLDDVIDWIDENPDGLAEAMKLISGDVVQGE